MHSILFPLSPFIVARIRNLDKDGANHSQSSAITQNIGVTSRDTGILVALYAVGLLGKYIYKIDGASNYHQIYLLLKKFLLIINLSGISNFWMAR